MKDETDFVREGLSRNPLVKAIWRVFYRIKVFKEQVRDFYYDVILSAYPCPKCGDRLKMIGQSKCSCSCGNVLDPTIAFQKSSCCNACLVRKTFHYACSKCNKTVPSWFLFDEKLFDNVYFQEMMQESRKRAKSKKEEIRKLLAESRSGRLSFMEGPDLGSVPGLLDDLNDFVRGSPDQICHLFMPINSPFNMDNYRKHILSGLGWDSLLFSRMDPLIENRRLDKIYRFVTLIFMQNDREVELTQHGHDLLVQRVYHEAYS